MFELLYSSGLRGIGTGGARHRDFLRGDGNLVVLGLILNKLEVHVTGKGNKQRIVPVGQAALQAQCVIGSQCAGNWLNRSSFSSMRVAPGCRCVSVQLRLKQHAQKAGINSDVHPSRLASIRLHRMSCSLLGLRAVQRCWGIAQLLRHRFIRHSIFSILRKSMMQHIHR